MTFGIDIETMTHATPSSHICFGHDACFCVMHHDFGTLRVNYRLSSTPHLFTIDVEDWRDDRLFDELAAADAHATFFVTAALIRRNTALSRRIISGGHELAVLGQYTGDDWYELSDDIRGAKRILEDASGVRVLGYRSPRVMSGPAVQWRRELLAENGYEYDSSRPSREGRSSSYAQTIVCGSGSLLDIPVTLTANRLYATLRAELASHTRTGLASVVSIAACEPAREIARNKPWTRLSVLRDQTEQRAARDRASRLLREFRFDSISNRLPELAQVAPASYAA